MNPDLFRRASEVFLAIRGTSAAQRDEILRQRCGDDAALRHAVESFLAHDSPHDSDHHTRLVGDAVGKAAAEVFGEGSNARTDGDDPLIGVRIGRYTLLERIGEGGMGTVYRAQQENPQRVVAVKVIRRGVMSRELIRRFSHEAQVLGRLQHPGIAQIYEAGMDDQGEGAQPYFAMELVNGLPLLAHAEHCDLDMRGRLELLARIADAVEHAHQKGVIHRDLKPGNILVDGSGQPKILDFGVARAVDSDVQATTLHTTAGQLIGTIAYMSPEQMSGDAERIDTRSDVYALGVIGFEMLSGALPFDVRGKSVPEAVRLISETDVTRLSGTHRGYRGDVQTIMAKAMERDVERRYASAAEFAADIRRYLRDEPIIARRASTVYQVRKFARRNKVLVGGVVAVFIVLVAGIIGTSIGMTRAIHQAQKARRMNDYMRGMILFLDPSQIKGQEVTLHQVLGDAARRVNVDLANEPDIAADMFTMIAEGFFRLEEYESAERYVRQSLALQEEQGGPPTEGLAETWELLGRILFFDEKLAGAEQAIRSALAINKSCAGPGSPAVLYNLRDLTHLLQLQGKPAEIDGLIQQALELVKKLPNAASDEVAQGVHAMADMLATQHRVEEAEPYYRRSIDIQRKLQRPGRFSREYMVVLRDFSLLLEMYQRWEESEQLDREALALCREHYGNDHADTLTTMNGVLSKLRGQQKFEEAEVLAREARDISIRLYGEDSESTAVSQLNLGIILRLRGHADEAVPCFESALKMRRAQQPANEVELGKALGGLGASLVDCGRGGEAEPVLRECLSIREKTLPPNHPNLAMVRSLLGASIAARGGYEEAEPLLLSAWQILSEAPQTSPQIRREAAQRLVVLYDAWNKPDQAEPYRRRLAAESAAPSPTSHPATGQ